jgi:hypothetical protein
LTHGTARGRRPRAGQAVRRLRRPRTGAIRSTAPRRRRRTRQAHGPVAGWRGEGPERWSRGGVGTRRADWRRAAHRSTCVCAGTAAEVCRFCAAAWALRRDRRASAGKRVRLGHRGRGRGTSCRPGTARRR